MEVLLGITGKDFTLIAASKAAMRGATILKASDDKTRALNTHTLMAFSGEAGDTVQFAEFIQANVQLYSMRNNMELSPAATANFVRGELASALRSRKPYTVNLLLGGYDTIADKPTLYWIDYLASQASLPYAAHGYAQYVVFSPTEINDANTCIPGTTASPCSISTTTRTSTTSKASSAVYRLISRVSWSRP